MRCVCRESVVPVLSKLFASTDRSVRRSLLESIDTYGPHLTQAGPTRQPRLSPWCTVMGLSSLAIARDWCPQGVQPEGTPAPAQSRAQAELSLATCASELH